MVSTHNQIVEYLAGKMQRLGFVIKHLEGPYASIAMAKPELPPRILNHRPDIIGIHPDGALGIGEAKTVSDLSSPRTRTQLLDFKKIIGEHPRNVLFLGVPADCHQNLRKLLNRIGVKIDTQVDIMVVPMELIKHD